MENQKTQMKTQNTTTHNDNDFKKCNAFVNAIVTKHENSIIRQKTTALKNIVVEYSPVELGFNSNVENIKLSFSREHINKILSGVLGVSVDNFKKYVLDAIEKANAYGVYNTEVRKLLKENKNLLSYK